MSNPAVDSPQTTSPQRSQQPTDQIQPDRVVEKLINRNAQLTLELVQVQSLVEQLIEQRTALLEQVKRAEADASTAKKPPAKKAAKKATSQ